MAIELKSTCVFVKEAIELVLELQLKLIYLNDVLFSDDSNELSELFQLKIILTGC